MTRALGALLVAGWMGLGAAHAQQATREWDPHWPRFSTREAAATFALGLGALAAEFAEPAYTEGRWHGGILFDDPVRGWLRARSEGASARAVINSDRLYRLSLVAPLVLDVWVLALGVHGSPDVAGQLFLMTLESFAFTGSAVLVTQLITRRDRPYVQDCGKQVPGGTPLCGTKRDHTSFLSGHTAIAMTSAMLMCQHHRHLALLGSAAADLGVCGAMVGVAVGTGVLRIVGDRHYATDVLAGLALGVVSGYVLPAWLHYGFGPPSRERAGPHPTFTLAPQLAANGFGLRLSGLLP